jgi:copper chaperone CopZ
MFLRSIVLLGLTACLACLTARDAAAEPPKANYTTIQVEDMHCMACAKKIAAKLYAVPGVVKVHAAPEKDLAYVVPQKRKAPSPRAMWEAVEAAGFKMVSMSGPGGDFTSKPDA